MRDKTHFQIVALTQSAVLRRPTIQGHLQAHCALPLTYETQSQKTVWGFVSAILHSGTSNSLTLMNLKQILSQCMFIYPETEVAARKKSRRDSAWATESLEVPYQVCVFVWTTDILEFTKLESENRF